MEHIEAVIISLLVAVVVLSALATRLGLPYPILLVLGGLVLGFVPWVPDVELQPELVLVVFLPPLLYSGAFFASLRDLRADARSITLLSTGLVVAGVHGLPRRRLGGGLRRRGPPAQRRDDLQ